MNPLAPWEEIERLYHRALELPLGERKALLSGVSPALRDEVESLLEADSSPDLLSAPPTHLAAGQRVANYVVESLITAPHPPWHRAPAGIAFPGSPGRARAN